MDETTAALDRQQRAKESSVMVKSATSGSRRSSGAGGFVTSSASAASRPAPKDVSGPAGLSSGVISTAAQEAQVQDKAAHGIPITNDDLGYMGHFAGDTVTSQGHNVGKKPKGIATDTGIARRGYRALSKKVDGMGRSAGALYDTAAPTDPMTFPGGPTPKPMSPNDLRMSIKHHKDSIDFETGHERDHQRGLAKATKSGDAKSAAYHREHLTSHAKKKDEHVRELSQRQQELLTRTGRKK